MNTRKRAMKGIAAALVLAGITWATSVPAFEILTPLKGRTAVFVFWDGEYTGMDPVQVAKDIAKKHDVCLYVVSSAKPKREAEMMKNVPTLNNCSRVIRLADFFNHPEYTTGA